MKFDKGKCEVLYLGGITSGTSAHGGPAVLKAALLRRVLGF